MGAAIGLRGDFDGPALRRLAKATKQAGQARRLLALAVIYDGGSRGDAARIGDVGLQTVRDWVLRFNAHGPEGLIDGKAPGNRARLGETERPGTEGDCGERADPGGARRGALAAEGSRAVAVRDLQDIGERDHGEPGTEGARLSAFAIAGPSRSDQGDRFEGYCLVPCRQAPIARARQS